MKNFSSFFLRIVKRFAEIGPDKIFIRKNILLHLNGRFVFPGLEKRIQIGVEIEAEDETDPRKQSHPFGDRYPVVGTRLP